MDPIITGMVGYGGSGKYFHAPFLKENPGFHFKSIVERNHKQAELDYPGLQSLSDFDFLIADPQIELVVITTPNQTHFALALRAMQAGKHVIIEKPFTSNTMEALELIKISRERNLFLGVYQNRRLEGDFLTIQKIIQDGLIGDIVEFESHFDRFRPGFNVKAWKEIKSPGTGLVFDLGSHLIDQALVLFGLPEYVSATIKALRPHSNVDDYFFIRLEYPGKEIFLRSSIFVKMEGPRFILHGKKGSYIKYGVDIQEKLLMAGQKPIKPDWAPEPKEFHGEIHTQVNGLDFYGKIPSITASYMSFYDMVYKRIRENIPFPIKPEQAYHTIRIIELAIESSQQKKSIPYSCPENLRNSFSLV